jgi:hypothetical protein
MAPTDPAAPALGASPLQASLTSYRLSLLVPALCEGSHTSGVLTVERGRVKRGFTFRDGLLVSSSSSLPGEHLTQVLADLRVLDVERAAEAFEAAEQRRQPLGEYLVQRGLVDRPRLLEAMEQKTREGFFDCYLWASGSLRFRPGDIPAGRVEMKVKPMALHRDGLARLREWKAFQEALPDLSMTFQVERGNVRGGGTPEEQAILDAAEGGSTLQDLLEVGGGGALSTSQRILQLHQRGALVPWAPLGSEPEAANLEQEVLWVQSLVARGSYEQAAKEALKLMDRAPEAHRLFREAESQLEEALVQRALQMEDRIRVDALPRPLPADLTADDVYLFLRLKRARSVGELLKTVGMGEVAAARCLLRLVDCEAVKPLYGFL